MKKKFIDNRGEFLPLRKKKIPITLQRYISSFFPLTQHNYDETVLAFNNPSKTCQYVHK